MKIIIPSYFEYHDSLYFTNFFDDISISELSSLYERDRDAFHAVLLEMKMRGFVFESDKALSPLFKRSSKPQNLIIVNDPNGQNYQKINFEKLGLGSFVYRFGVRNDQFFDRFPLEGFLEMNPNVELILLRESFLRAGFQITPLGQVHDEDRIDIRTELKHQEKFFDLSEAINLESLSVDQPIRLDDDFLEKNFHNLSFLDDLSFFEQDYFLSMSNLGRKDYQVAKQTLQMNRDKKIDEIGIDGQGSFFSYLEMLEREERKQYLSSFLAYTGNPLILEEMVEMNVSSRSYLWIQSTERSYDYERKIYQSFRKIWDERVKGRDGDILEKRLGENRTLAEIGSMYGMSRERIRQIVQKVKNMILALMKKKRLVPKFEKEVLNKRKYYSFDEMMKHLTKVQAEVFLELLLEESKNINYQENWRIITNSEYLQEDYIFKKYFKTKQILSVNYIEQVIDEIENRSQFRLSIEQIEELLKNKNYREYKQLWTASGVRDVHIYGYIIENYFDGVYHTEKDIGKMKEIYQDIYREKSLKSRNVYARLQDNPDYLLVDSYLFKHYAMNWKQEQLTQQIEFVEQRASKHLKKYRRFAVNDDYVEYTGPYQKLGIESGLHAFSLLRRFRDKKYTFAPGNLLEVYANTDYHLSRSEELELFVKEHGPVLDKKTVEEKTKFERYTIDQTINNSKHLLGWGTGFVRYIDPDLLSENEAEIDRLLKFIFDYFGDEIALPIEPLYLDTLFGGFNELYHDLSIENSEQLLSFLSSIYQDEFQSRGKFLLIKERASEFVIEEAVMNYLPNFFTKEEFSEIMKEEFNYATTTIYQYLNKGYRNNIIYQIDQNLYCTKEEFNLSKEAQKEIIEWLLKKVDNKDYIVLNNIFINSNQLPPLNFSKEVPYNDQLIATILEINGYKSLTDMNNAPYPVFVYSKNPQWKNFEDLIYDRIKDKKIYHYDELEEQLKIFFNYNSDINIEALIRSFEGKKIKVNFDTLDVDMERIL